MTEKDIPRIVLTGVIIAYFGFALFAHWSEGLEETLKNIVMLAVGFWLGSSKGSSDKAAQLERMGDGPQSVVIDQPSDRPVPVDEKP